MRYRLSIEILCLLLISCASTATPTATPKPRPRVADPSALIARGLVFTGSEGIRVEAAELTSGDTALVRVTGLRSEVEGKVLEHRIADDGTRLNYITQIDGRDQYTLVREKPRHGSGAPSWHLYVRGTGANGHDIAYDEKASQALDTVALYRTHEDQRDAGTLEALQRFDRKDEERQDEEALAETRQSMAEACQTDVAVTIDWSTIDDDMLEELSISGYCGHALDAMRSLCEAAPARAFAADKVQQFQCRFGGEMSLTVADRTMTWTVNREGVNMSDFARDVLVAQAYRKSTLGQEIAVSNTQVCADEKRSRYIVFAPDGSKTPGMLYGDGKAFYQVNTPKMMSNGWFFEPRHFNPQYNANFRGLDLREHSHVEVKKDEAQCVVTCGVIEHRIPLLPANQVPALMSRIELGPTPMPRLPHALARDRNGIYYLVDRSTEPGRERDFRLYVGPLGNLQRQAMKNVVTDSEGEIFSSKAGDLRFILGREEVLWISGKRERKLLMVPIEDNWQMIFNDLGVYYGVQMGTPCDDYGVK